MDSLKITLRILIPFLLIFIIVFATNKITESNKIKKNRAKVHDLISVGQNLLEAQDILKREGFKLVYDEPIDSTGLGKYVTQLIIVGDTMPDIDDTFFYVLTGGGSPFTSESPYVGIEANQEGIITLIE